jgi:hypothetical protein
LEIWLELIDTKAIAARQREAGFVKGAFEKGLRARLAARMAARKAEIEVGSCRKKNKENRVQGGNEMEQAKVDVEHGLQCSVREARVLKLLGERAKVSK